jgi:hypothetical protein
MRSQLRHVHDFKFEAVRPGLEEFHRIVEVADRNRYVVDRAEPAVHGRGLRILFAAAGHVPRFHPAVGRRSPSVDNQTRNSA